MQAKYLQWCDGKGDFSDQTAKAFEVSVNDIRAMSYDLSINRYKQQITVEMVHERPEGILRKLRSLEQGILTDIDEIEELLK